MGSTVDPPPPDFRNIVSFKNGSDVAAIAQTIATGILWEPVGATSTGAAPQHHDPSAVPAEPGSLGGPNLSSHMSHKQGMPGFSHLSETERQALALYVISLDTSARKGALIP